MLALTDHIAEADAVCGDSGCTDEPVVGEVVCNHLVGLGPRVGKSSRSEAMIPPTIVCAAGKELPFVYAQIGLGVNLTQRLVVGRTICEFSVSPWIR